MASATLAELSRLLCAQSVSFDGSGHTFVIRQRDYDEAAGRIMDEMKRPKAERPRGWSRHSRPDGMMLIRVQMH